MVTLLTSRGALTSGTSITPVGLASGVRINSRSAPVVPNVRLHEMRYQCLPWADLTRCGSLPCMHERGYRFRRFFGKKVVFLGLYNGQGLEGEREEDIQLFLREGEENGGTFARVLLLR